MAFAENDVCTYKGRTVRLLFPAPPPLGGWVAVRIHDEGNGGRRRTGNRVHVKDMSKLEAVIVQVPITRASRRPAQEQTES